MAPQTDVLTVDRLVRAVRILVVVVVLQLRLERALAHLEIIRQTGVDVRTAVVGVRSRTRTHRRIRTGRSGPHRRFSCTGFPGRSIDVIDIGLAVVLVHVHHVVVGHANETAQALRPRGQVLLQRHVQEQQAVVVLVVGRTARLAHRVLRTRPGRRVRAAREETVLVTHRERGRRDRVHHVPGVDVRARTAVFHQHTQQVHPHVRRRGQVDVQVHAHVAAYVLILRAVALVHLRAVDEALVGDQVQHREVAQTALATAELHVEVVRRSRVLERLVNPVHIRVQVGILAALERAQLLVIVHRSDAVVGTRLVRRGGIRVAVHELRLVQQLVEHVVVGETHHARVRLAALRRQKDRTVDPLVAVQRSRRGILQDRHALHLLRRHARDRTLDAVDQHQRRRVAVQRLKATHVERRVHVRHDASSLQRDQTQTLTDDTVANILGLPVPDLLRRDDGYRRRRLLHRQLRPRLAGLDHPLLEPRVLGGRCHAERRRQR